MAKILVVEDERMIRILLARWLADAGYTVVEAADGAEGETRFAEEAPDLVVTDLSMPAEDGLTLIASLKAKDPSLPIVAISGVGGGEGEHDYLGRARKKGANSILQKPFDAADLLALIRNLL